VRQTDHLALFHRNQLLFCLLQFIVVSPSQITWRLQGPVLHLKYHKTAVCIVLQSAAKFISPKNVLYVAVTHFNFDA